MIRSFYFFLLILLLATACGEDEGPDGSPDPEGLYFPPNSAEWSSISPEELGWNVGEIDNLLSYLEANGTRAFIVLKDGEIVLEEYFGNTILGNSPFGVNSPWYWASAGKSLTATLVGIAQQEGDLSINNPSSDYLGEGWTSLATDQEQQILVEHQLTMSTGLDYTIGELDCTRPDCLGYKSAPGDQWYYHNAPYTLLEKVVENATGINYNTYTDQKIENIIGMNGQWITQGFNNVYWSTARDMARFGLLILNEGIWKETPVLDDRFYFEQMTNTSQNLNLAYGYLWWLNGKSSIIPPSFSFPLNVPLSEAAPPDLIAGLGRNGQFVEVIPSQNLVVIRMGEAPDDGLVPLSFHNEMWERINRVLIQN